MLRRARSIRQESELPFDGEAAVRPVSGIGGSRLPSGLARADALAQAAQPGTGEEGPEDGNPGEETAYGAQPSGSDGVPEDMATMVLNGQALGAGPALRPGATPEPRAGLREKLDPKSDAAIMLRVAEGDEAEF